VFICNECVELCNDIVREELSSELVKKRTPQQLLMAADQSIPGQSEAKRLLAAAIKEHYSRSHFLVSNKLSSVFVVGPTGSGRNELIKAMANTLDAPLAVIDVPLLFAGSPFKAKYEFAGFNEKPGIVLLNRIDAAAMRGSDKEAARLVQGSLISILDGAIVYVVGENNSPVIDTSRVLFIAVGTFVHWPPSSGRFGTEAHPLRFTSRTRGPFRYVLAIRIPR
jgi:ATP-dependent Clp protease ATP-binding subunit ClpX